MLSSTNRTEIKKGAHKAVTDVDKLHAIIDESLIAHIAITNDTGPVVIPMLAWRVDNYVYIHGANNSRLLRSLKQGVQTCLTFTLFDGWVLARSAFHHSAHYRSAVVFGQFEVVEDNNEKDRLLNHFIEQIAPGRTEEVRLSNEKELKATMLLRISLAEASVKVSNFGVNDDAEDMDLPVWAGVLPYRTVVGPLQACDDLYEGILEPDYRSAYPNRWQE
ncbi:Pyridoxamine 5'-phosphate oxidase-related, FMN-binding [Vibrio harveyi]|jgi:nitroimidazol reductase NimA-like FMN-containing flavoprotein (pyridoxamine 5'-phosphate oxidase superfamily)|uniref:pyridoxamine 5'-phosphate oxidase family protein n=1 Tax=Vibrio TaxID=662 RepID=UPI0006807063|nr:MULTISPECIES: pyridoxamine 5'-phosphate oxidase family protein [Vibrio]AWB02141.1 pyridoxamine 5'-phosphate oxidase family protein [Vibrio harveyi]EKO3809535.1 pyridoxamine 5'-phosphate oxidase family protein [Vibrio harveyi]EKO3824534.1 pyridoxamine 5'-phosphate oxidase family protein [Vibrio harveyi]EKO3830668.1 pyridoxamine 5'-phosphate oxidase family protein [Vibrio harveyi]EKO3843090.1 pyridoxamine 5'-phosphate oxidase family protein [Vibrio harveyi]